MSYTFKSMTQDQAEHIAYVWQYNGIYSFYNMESDKDDLQAFLDPTKRGDAVFVVFNENELIGFFTFDYVNPLTITIGLGLKPNQTSIGKGLKFLQAGILFAKQNYNPQFITLSVAAFNERAIKVYKKAGFETFQTYIKETNGDHYEFIDMIYHIY